MKLLTLFWLTLLTLASPARAIVIIDSGQCVSGCFPLPLGVSISGHTFDAFGIEFTTATPYRLTSISSTFAGYGTGIFSVYSLAGGLPDQPLFSQAFSVPVHSGYGEYSVSLNTLLAPGTWALVATPDPGVTSLTAQSGPAGPGFVVYPSFAKIDGVWHGLPASYAGQGLSFELNGDSVPEPATWATMLLGFALIGASLRRRAGAVLVPASSARR